MQVLPLSNDMEDDKGNKQSNDASKKAMMMKRNSLMGDDLFDPSELELDDEDWRDVFDDVGPSGGNNNNNNSSNSSQNFSMPPPQGKKRDSPLKGQTEDSIPKPRRKTSAQIERVDRGGPPPTWHSAEADLQHRQQMVQDIAQLLYARKKDNPGKKWLDQLPLKARQLETQLYKSATSLEAYLDRKTLKNRLGKLASAITTHYKQAIQGRRSSMSSVSSLGSLETKFSNANLRRASTGTDSAQAAAIPTQLRRENSAPVNRSAPGPFLNKLTRRQSDTAVSAGTNEKNSASNQSTTPAAPTPNVVTNVPGQNTAVQQTPGNMNTLVQQQLLATMRQQQQQSLQSGQNANSQLMAAQAAMMGGANGMAMMNPLQQQGAMNMMQQQNAQAAMRAQANIALLQQQQNQMFMGNMGNMPNGGMNMMRFSLPNVIPGVGAGNPQNFNAGTNQMMARDNTAMPPPSNLAGSTNTPRRNGPGNDESNPLSPNSFHW